MGKHDNDNTRQNIGNIKKKRSVYFIDTLKDSYQKGDVILRELENKSIQECLEDMIQSPLP